MSGNLFACFAAAAERVPERTFLQAGERIFSYSDMLGFSAKAANVLRLIGIRRGDHVLVQVEKSPTALFLYLGCLRAGAIFIPLNTAYTADELRYFISDSEPALLVCAAGAKERLEDRGNEAGPDLKILTLEPDESGSFAEHLSGASTAFVTAEVGCDDVAAILYTSGTTGRSKGAMLSHRNLQANVEALNAIWAWQDDDVLLHSLPVFHAHGLFVALHCALFRASTIIFHSRFEASAVVRDLPLATVFMGVPTFYVRLLKERNFSRAAIPGIRLFISGSAPLTETVFAAFEERTGHRILERYGMTEALMITSNPYNGERVAGSVGFPLPGVEARVENADWSGEQGPGVLEIKGPSVFKGYWRQPDKTRDAFTKNGFFRTGDIARITGDGRVFLVGRSTDLVISGGYNVYPKEIELLIDEMPGVEEAAVIGVPHADFGEAVVALVVPKRGETIDPEHVAETLRDRLAAFKRPKRVISLGELPRNAMGKVEKAALRKRYQDLFAGQMNFPIGQPRNPEN